LTIRNDDGSPVKGRLTDAVFAEEGGDVVSGEMFFPDLNRKFSLASGADPEGPLLVQGRDFTSPIN